MQRPTWMTSSCTWRAGRITWSDCGGCLRRVGLTANPRKCHLALSEAKYLGYQVGRCLIKPQEKKVAAILSAPRPTSKTQVRAFLGLAGYYRCFIPNFWAPDFNCPFLLQTDASNTGLGAVLSQVQDGEEHPVIYISRKLTPAEQRYAAVEKEALAAKWAVLELRYYLLGRKFTLITDYSVPIFWWLQRSNHLKLFSWTWQWVHFTQMASTVTRSQSNRAPLGCGWSRDSHHGWAADKSAATAWCYHVNMNQNLWGMFPTPCWIYATKN